MYKKFPFIVFTYGRPYFVIGYSGEFRHRNITIPNDSGPMYAYNITQNNGSFAKVIIYLK